MPYGTNRTTVTSPTMLRGNNLPATGGQAIAPNAAIARRLNPIANQQAAAPKPIPRDPGHEVPPGPGPGKNPPTHLPGQPIPRDPEDIPGDSDDWKHNPRNPNYKPPKAKKQSDIQKWLGTDEQYQKDRADLIKNFRNMALGNKENRGNLKLDYQTTKTNMSDDEAKAARAMADDFAARGMFGGAGFLKEQGDFNQDYLKQATDAKTSYDRNLSSLLRDLGNAKTLRDQNLQQARLEAIRRRAASLGIMG